ncbi:unnamed protein product [Wickerhamomyces anomalus]
MVAYYSIFGKQVASHWVSVFDSGSKEIEEEIAIGTLSAAAAVAVVPGYLPKSEAPAKAPTPAPVQTKKEDDLDVEKLLT